MSALRPLAMSLFALALTAPALHAAQAQTMVVLAPAVAARMSVYGESERATLESAIDEALRHATRQHPLPVGLSLRVTVADLEPSHPTKAQLMATPSLDPTRTHFLGGAELAGEVRDADGRVLATVRHRYFPPTLKLGSASLDPWADARRAIEQFAEQMAAACRDLPRRTSAARGASAAFATRA